MIPLENILKLAQGKIVCVFDDRSREFSSAAEVIKSGLYEHCIVSDITAKEDAIVLKLERNQPPTTEENGKWIEDHKKQFGSNPSFF